MGRKKWTTSEDKLIRELYPTVSNHYLAKLMNRSEQVIRQRACTFGIKKLTQDELEYDDIDSAMDYIARRNYVKAHIDEQTGVLARKLKVNQTTIQRIKKQIINPQPPRTVEAKHLCMTCKYACNGYYSKNGKPVRRDDETMYKKGYCCWADKIEKYPDGVVTKQDGYLNLTETYPRLFVQECPLYELG